MNAWVQYTLGLEKLQYAPCLKTISASSKFWMRPRLCWFSENHHASYTFQFSLLCPRTLLRCLLHLLKGRELPISGLCFPTLVINFQLQILSIVPGFPQSLQKWNHTNRSAPVNEIPTLSIRPAAAAFVGGAFLHGNKAFNQKRATRFFVNQTCPLLAPCEPLANVYTGP